MINWLNDILFFYLALMFIDRNQGHAGNDNAVYTYKNETGK